MVKVVVFGGERGTLSRTVKPGQTPVRVLTARYSDFPQRHFPHRAESSSSGRLACFPWLHQASTRGLFAFLSSLWRHTHACVIIIFKTGSLIIEPGVRGKSGQVSSGSRDVAGAAGSPLRHFGLLLLTARPPFPAAARFHNLMLSFFCPPPVDLLSVWKPEHEEDRWPLPCPDRRLLVGMVSL